MNAVTSFSDALDALGSTSLRFRPKTDGPITNSRAMVEAFERMSDSERSHSREAIQPALGMKLLALSGFMAEAAINLGDVSWIRAALVLHAIEDFKKDYRENFRYLVLIAYASKQLELDLPSTLETMASVASGRAKRFLSDFAGRAEELNRLDAFGISGQVVDGSFRFVPV